jgi:hypothetical protein
MGNAIGQANGRSQQVDTMIASSPAVRMQVDWELVFGG